MEPMMNRFLRVCTLADIPAKRGRPAFADGRLVVLFKVDSEVFALDDSCPHAGSSLAAGEFDGTTVTCRAHGLRYDVRTGRIPGVDGLRATTYPVQVSDGQVFVGTECGAASSSLEACPAAGTGPQGCSTVQCVKE
jgi:3-phenylpropionate/trans-cinnamate dioxygenase ferredoxin subunit